MPSALDAPETQYCVWRKSPITTAYGTKPAAAVKDVVVSGTPSFFTRTTVMRFA